MTPEDQLRDYVYFGEHSKTVQSSKRRFRYSPPLVCMALAVLIGVFGAWNAGSILALATSTVVSLLWLPLAPMFWQRRVESHVNKMLKERHIRSREAVTVTVALQGIQIEGEDGDTRLKWSAISKVTTTPSHINLFTGSASGLSVPKAAFANETACDRFLQAIRDYREQAAGLIANEIE